MTAWTPDEKARAVGVYVSGGTLGEAQASIQREDGSKPTKDSVKRWAVAAGHDVDAGRATAKTAMATAARIAQMDQRKTELAADLLEDLQRLRVQLFAPCIEQKVVTLSGGQGNSATWEIVEVARDKPTFTDQVKILTSIGIAVDKVQILTGAATDRIDITGDVRARAVELADELAARRERKAA